MLALVVELLVTALTGAQFGFEAFSFFEAEGNRPRTAQAFLLIDPGALAGRDVYDERIETLVGEMLGGFRPRHERGDSGSRDVAVDVGAQVAQPRVGNDGCHCRP